MTARTIRISGTMAAQSAITVDDRQAQRGDGGRGDALIALGEWIDARLEHALVPLGAFAGVYFIGHLAVAAARGLL